MNFNQYQSEALKTSIIPTFYIHNDETKNLVAAKWSYPLIGLQGEIGEVSEKFKKCARDKGGIVDNETKESLKLELGDVLWYISAICSTLDLKMDDVAQANIEKLKSRRDRNKLHGSGDLR